MKKNNFKPVFFFVVSLMMGLLLTSPSCKENEKESDVAVVEDTLSNQKPNIIYIMADDLTIQPISAYGGIYKDIAPKSNV